MTVAHLGLAVDSSGVSRATPELQKMTAAAGKAEAAAERLGRASGGTNAVMQKMHDVLVSIERDLTVLTHHTVNAGRAFDTLGGSASRAGNLIANTMMQRRNLMFQLADIGQGVPLLFQSPGYGLINIANQMTQVGQAYYGQGGMGQALKDAGGIVGGLVTKFAPLLATLGLASLGIAGMTAAINENSDVTVNWGDTATAVFQVVGNGIWQWVKPAVDWIGDKLSTFWEWIAPGLKAAGNGIIATFLGAFDAIKIAWSALPSVMGDVAYSAANFAIKGIEWLVDAARDRVNDLIGLVNNIPGLDIPTLDGPINFGGIDNPYEGAMAGVAKDVAGAFSGAFGNDYLGQFFGAVSGQAQKNALARQAEDAEKATKSLADNGFGQLIGMTNTFADATSSAFRNLGTGIIDAFKKGGDVASNFFTMILDRVGQVGESLLNTGLNSLLDIGINAIFGGIGGGLGSGGIGRGTYGGMGGFFPAFPGMASGGTVGAAGMSWVGENGPELLRLPKGAQVIPNGPSMAIASNQNSQPVISINIDARGAAAGVGPDIAREVRKALPDAMQAYQRNPLRRAG